jgi:carbamate kinase
MTVVIALGGNALIRAGESGSAEEEHANLERTCHALAPLLAESRIVITHGNGPQVGNELLRQERAADEVPPFPLHVVVAQTQAEIGSLLEQELAAASRRPVACVLTHVRVDPRDPAFAQPTKPVGLFYTESEAHELARLRGWTFADADRGWRRVVPSPVPLEIVELGAIRALVASGTIVVACGGGGIPVVVRDGRMQGIDAVIDKDRASSLIAELLGARRLVILTDVPAVYRDFREAEDEVRKLDLAAADVLAPTLAPGSMRPKVEAAASFVRSTGGEALITSPEALEEALAGRAGTRVSK